MDETGNCIVTAGININISYPLEFAAQTDFTQSTIDNFIDSETTAMLDAFRESIFEFPSPGPWALDMGYELFVFNRDIVGIKFDAYQYSGGAHGLPYVVTFMFHLTENRLITLDDLFQEEFNPWLTIQPMVKAQLMEAMGDFADEGWIDDGTGENPDNYVSFVLDGEELVFYFQAYQVAPYAAGMHEARIPLTDINALSERAIPDNWFCANRRIVHKKTASDK